MDFGLCWDIEFGVCFFFNIQSVYILQYTYFEGFIVYRCRVMLLDILRRRLSERQGSYFLPINSVQK